MKHFFYTAFLISLFSCNQKEQPLPQGSDKPITAKDSVAVVNDPKVNLNVQMDAYTEIDSSAVLLFPLSVSENEDKNGYSRSYKDMPNNEYWNIAFLNSKTNEYHLLGENKMLISSYEYNVEGYEKSKALDQKIFYTTKTTDFNKDKLINEKDPTYLFVSDKRGYNFKQISPLNYHFVKWAYIDSSNKFILTLKKDTDKNNLFDEKDETVMFDVNANFEKEATEIFSVDFKNKLKVLFDRDWKRVKQ
jgi:hypothetical protein